MLNLNTEERGLELCKQYLDPALVPAIFAGTHRFNPYHNERHELQTVYHAYCAWISLGRSVNDPDLNVLLTAAAFHDHDHSGGVTSDADNIKAATRSICCLHSEALAREWNSNLSTAANLDQTCNSQIDMRFRLFLRRVVSVIECTQFNGSSFEREPMNEIERCIRDADLMAIYTEEGRDLTVGLALEMRTKFDKEFADRSYTFLNAQPTYTPYGHYMKISQLRLGHAYLVERARDIELETAKIYAADSFRANGT